ncbi:MAG: flavodoxin, partial [Acidimicrobiia bacterium]
LKHFFDQIFYPCVDATTRRPYALYVHGNDDVTGAVRAVEAIAGGLGWRRVQAPLRVIGKPGNSDREAGRELGAAVAATLALEAEGSPEPR